MSSKAKSKKPTQEDEDPDVDASAPMPKPSKKKGELASAPPKKNKSAAPDPDDDPDEEDADGEEPATQLTAEAIEKLQNALKKKRKKAKLVGYRSLSKAAGYRTETDYGSIHSASNDCIGALLSEADAKRVMRYVPATPGCTAFKSGEFPHRLSLFKHSVPASAARETQARADMIMRSVMNDAVLRSVEANKKTISASTMASVLRPYASLMELTAVVTPLGLVRYGQENGIINPSSEEELKKRGDEKKENAANKKAYVDFVDSKEKVRAAKRMKKYEAQAAAHAVVTAP